MYAKFTILSTLLASALASPQNPTYSTLPAPPAQPKPTGTNLALGESCDPSLPNVCANGVNCYATNYMLQPRCGNFQSTCSTDSQCAYNKCLGGVCSGPPLMSSSITQSAMSTTATASTLPSPNLPKPTGTNLGLGEDCDPALPNACANSVNCYATNSFLIPRCGNFQASCTTDSQCAFNTCNLAVGLCNGFLPSSTSGASATTTSQNQTPTTIISTLIPSGGVANSTITGSPTSTRGPSGSVTPPLMANGAAHFEGGVIGVFGVIAAALVL